MKEARHPKNIQYAVDEIPITDWNEENDQAFNTALGPANLRDAFLPLSALTGDTVFIFSNNKYDLGEFEDYPIMRVDPQTIIDIICYASEYIGSERYMLVNISVSLISDGYISHAVSMQGVSKIAPDRLVFCDPWYINSFLEEGHNLVGIAARSEGQGRFSITFDEYKKVVVAVGFLQLTDLKGLEYRQLLSQLRVSEFYKFFHISEIAVSQEYDPFSIQDDFYVLKLETGGFKEFIDIRIVVENDGIYYATLRLSRQWICQYGINPFASDILKSFIDAFIPKLIDLSQIRVSFDPIIPNPDRKQIDFLVSAICSLNNRQELAKIFSQPSSITEGAFPILETYVGHRESAALKNLTFTEVKVKNLKIDGEEQFQIYIDISPTSRLSNRNKKIYQTQPNKSLGADF